MKSIPKQEHRLHFNGRSTIYQSGRITPFFYSFFSKSQNLANSEVIIITKRRTKEMLQTDLKVIAVGKHN